MAAPAGGPADESPAARYAASRVRQAERTRYPQLRRFAAGLGFTLDAFQREACQALEDGRGVLVAAPTGAGKTVVGEFAVHLALAGGRKAFYTTPIKALSNQKHAELAARHGADAVGLLTGDTAVNGEAPVVVMTTEVLRNMLYAGSPTLAGLGYVVMDEVHYLADRFRGAVWEEVIIHLPETVQVVSLSATVSNAEEFGAWLDTVRGDTAVVVSEHRPVPLYQHVMVGGRTYDLFTDRAEADPGRDGAAPPRVNPELVRIAREDQRAGRAGAPGRGRGRNRPGRRPPAGRGHSGVPSRAQVVQRLEADGLLPAIVFVFSRAGCDAAVRQCLTWGVDLTTPAEREEIRRTATQRTAHLPAADLAVLGWWEWSEALSRGVASHHAGLLPAFKEVVEDLFARGLVRVVFATETLALGINMPARSVVLERLVKFNGETHADVTPGEYTQLTGRAGRRGIDVDGHAVVLWAPGVDPEAVAGLASTRTYPLRSSFRPTYSMAVNLVATVGRHRAREILETSFAQFQADRAVVGLARQVRKQEEALAGYAEAMTCHLGDFGEYARLRRRLSEAEKAASRDASGRRRADALASLKALGHGDVIEVPAGRRAGLAVVLDPGVPGGVDGPRPTVLTIDREVRRLSLGDVPGAVRTLTRVRVPKDFSARSSTSRRDLAAIVRAAAGGAPSAPAARAPDAVPDAANGAADVDDLRRALRQHPCHGCSEREDHARWAERHHRLEQETRRLAQRIEGRTNTIARTFDRVCDLLGELGYLAGDGDATTVTPAGQCLRRVYTEKDLLVAQSLRHGVWDDLDAPSLAAVVSAVLYESRRDDHPVSPRLPAGPVRAALAETARVAHGLADAEAAHRLQQTGEPDAGLALAVHRWASGRPLDEVLTESDLAAGDFVRWCRQVLDLLDQVAAAVMGGDAAAASNDDDAASGHAAVVSGDAAPAGRTGAVAGGRLRRTARAAAAAVDRGVVATASAPRHP